jgi:hypothetical protein
MGRYIFSSDRPTCPNKKNVLPSLSSLSGLMHGDILNQLKIRDNLLSKARKSETNSTSAWKQYRIVRNLA